MVLCLLRHQEDSFGRFDKVCAVGIVSTSAAWHHRAILQLRAIPVQTPDLGWCQH